MTSQRPLVFVSYRHMDSARVMELVAFIKASAEVWLDTERLYDPVEWASEARIAFEAADVLLVCYSSAAIEAARGSVFLEWHWFVGRGPLGPPTPVIVQLGHESAPPSQFIDIDPVSVHSTADYPAVVTAMLDAARGNVRRRAIPSAPPDPSPSIWNPLARLFGTKATPGASRWRDTPFHIEIPDVRADLLGEARVTWRRSYVGRPDYSVLQRDLERRYPFATLRSENDRASALTSLLLDLTAPRTFSFDDLGFVGLFEPHDRERIIAGYVRVADALVQSLQSQKPVLLQYERSYPTIVDGQTTDLRFIVRIRVMLLSRLAKLALVDSMRRRRLVADAQDAIHASTTDRRGEATSHVVAHLRCCRTPFVRKGATLEARVGIRPHPTLERLLAAGARLPNNLHLLSGHSMWAV